LKVYSHLFDRHRHAERTSAALEARFGTMLEQMDCNPWEPEVGEVVDMQAFRG
jgi:hypothetical protein